VAVTGGALRVGATFAWLARASLRFFSRGLSVVSMDSMPAAPAGVLPSSVTGAVLFFEEPGDVSAETTFCEEAVVLSLSLLQEREKDGRTMQSIRVVK